MILRLFTAAVLAAGLSVPGAFAALPAPPPSATEAAPMPSLAPMVKRVSPAVVNIATRGTIKEKPGQRNPLLDDPFFRRFFANANSRARARVSSSTRRTATSSPITMSWRTRARSP
jgi:S1-C subfamily serine protease